VKPRHWSYSSLSTFEQCPRRWKHKYKDKFADPRTSALERGILVHEQLEYALRAPALVPPLAKPPGDWLARIITRYLAIDRMQPEVALHLDKKWKRVANSPGSYIPPGTYVTGKLDVLAPGFIADWKTGKIYADKHEDQAHLYATMLASVTGILRWAIELVYTDQEHVESFEIQFDDPEGESLEAAQKSWDERATKIRAERAFPKYPSRLCDWCPFHEKKGGPCNGKR